MPQPKRAHRGGPYLVSALICREIAMEEDRPVLQGVTSRIGGHGDFSLALSVMVAPGAYLGAIRVTVDAEMPGMDALRFVDEDITREPGANLLWSAHPISVPLDQPGVIWFVVALNSREATRVPLEILPMELPRVDA